MDVSAIQRLEQGKTYLVAHRSTTTLGLGPSVIHRKVRRIFRGLETRFGQIPCAVFSSKIGLGTSAIFDNKTGILTVYGRAPLNEVSIPHYDLTTAELA